jgi:hypothetical protein
MADQPGNKGFIKSLYDFSFSSLVTTKIIKALYILITVVYSLFAIVAFIGLVSRGGVDIAIGLIVVPVAYIIYLAIARVTLEVVVVLFRIAEYVRDIRDQGQRTVPPPTSPTNPWS